MLATCRESTAERRLSSAERWICDRLVGGPLPMPAGLAVDAVAAAARDHRIHLALAEVCGTEQAADRDVRGALADDVRRAILYEAVREGECRHVVEACARAGLTPLIFKGAALAYSVYRTAWTRPFIDVDVLIREADLPALGGVLASIGYEPATQVDGRLITHQSAFVRSGRVGYHHQFDVHWRPFNPEPLKRVLTYEEVLTRSEPLPRLSPAARGSGRVDALLIAFVHRAAHHNDAGDLIWIWDIDRLARRLSSDDWGSLVAEARDRDVRGLCAAGLARAAGCFSTPVPDDVRRALGAGEPERSTVFLGGRLAELDIQLLNFASLRWCDRPAFVAQHLFPSAAYMRQAYGATSSWRLVWSYVARLAVGIPRWLAESRAARGPARS